MSRKSVSQKHQKKSDTTPTKGTMIQRQCTIGNYISRESELEKPGLSRNALRSNSFPSSVPFFVRDVLQYEGQPLNQPTRSFMETRFDQDFSHVRVHSGKRAANTALGVSARAYAVGNNIVFGHGQYSPQTNTGRTLIAHELAHVVQQDRGGSVPGFAHELDADITAKQVMGANTQPVMVRQASKIDVARSVNDWLESSRDVRQLGYSEIISDIDEINQWLGRQNTTTPDSIRLEEALDLLITEKNRKEKKSLGDKPKRRSRRRKSARKKMTDSSIRKPRILRERTSVQYETAEEVNMEIDLIIAWLEQDDISSEDRALLKNELDQLAPQFHQGREKAKAERRAARLQRVFDPSEDDGFTQLQRVTRVVQGIAQDPSRPDVFLIFHEGEQIPISRKQITNLRKEVTGHFRRGVSRTKARVKEGFGFYRTQVEINEESPIISSIAGWLGDAGDPFIAMTVRKTQVTVNLGLLEKSLTTDNFQAAADFLAKAERKSNEISAAGRAFNESHIRGAGLAVSGLEFTRDVSFAIAGSIAAVVAAPVLAAGAAGAGLTGAAAFGATTLGTGAVVGTGSAIVRGGSAGVGELASGSSLEDAGAAIKKEGKRGFKEGAVAGVTGGAAHTLGTAFGVGREGIKLSSQLGRRFAAEGTADFIGGATDAALRGEGLNEVLTPGAKNAAFGAPGILVGGTIKNPGVRAATETAVSSGTAFGGTLASGGSTEEAIASASVAAISSVAVRRAGRDTQPNTVAQQRAFAIGKRARGNVNSGNQTNLKGSPTLLQRQRAAALHREITDLQNKSFEAQSKAKNSSSSNPERSKRLKNLATELDQKASQKLQIANEFESGRRSATEDLPGPEDFPENLESLSSVGGVKIRLGKIPPVLEAPKTETVSGNRLVYRVEGKDVNRELVSIGPRGEVTIKQGSDIDFNFGSLERAQAFQKQKPGTKIKVFEVDGKWFDSVRSIATPEKGVGNDPIRDLGSGEPTKIKPLRGITPQTVDVTKASDQLKVHSQIIPELQDFIIPGSGRILDE